MRPLALLTALLTAPALFTGTAMAKEGATKAPAAAAPMPGVVGGFEGVLGFPGAFDLETDSGLTQEGSIDTTWGLVPWVEQKFGRVVGFGFEVMINWMQTEADSSSRMVISPHLRARMEFPIVDKVTADAFIAGGGTIWGSVDDADGPGADARFGWSMRFGFGGSYAINELVSVYGHLGWYTTTTYGDDVTINMNTVPLAAGLRANF